MTIVPAHFEIILGANDETVAEWNRLNRSVRGGSLYDNHKANAFLKTFRTLTPAQWSVIHAYRQRSGL